MIGGRGGHEHAPRLAVRGRASSVEQASRVTRLEAELGMVDVGSGRRIGGE